jgi:phosphate transport system substrate-binding protein
MTLPKSALLCLVPFICTLPLFSQQTRIGGPDTLIFLGQRFADQYSTRHPLAQFAVHGASAKAADLEIIQTEGSASKEKRVAFPIAIHAIVIYVNKSNPVHELTLSQVRDIFLGRTTNWKQLGGADRRINLFAGESTTGTLAYFQDAVLRGEEPYPFDGKNGTHALLEVIAADPSAIGYGSLDANPGVRGVAIKSGLTSLAIEPTIPAIRSRQYPITRYVYWAVPSDAPNDVKEFCRWVLSAEGQLIAEGAGFEPVLPQERTSGLAKIPLNALQLANTHR